MIVDRLNTAIFVRLACALTLLGASSAMAATLEAEDDFSSASAYAGGSGWTTNWTESGDDGTPGGGDITVSGGALQLVGDSGGNGFIVRELDVSELAAEAGLILFFDISFTGTLEGATTPPANADILEVFASSDGGSSWTEIRQFNGEIPFEGAPERPITLDISEFISDQTQIRFGVAQGLIGAGEAYTIDNVGVYSTPASLSFEADEIFGGNPLPTATGGGSAQIFDATNQPYSDDGVILSFGAAPDGSAPNGPVMIFDTAVPSGGDTDLGAPNGDTNENGNDCSANAGVSSTPGVGGDVSPNDGFQDAALGSAGENCRPLGLSVIISEDADATDPDDDGVGGSFIFDFDAPVEFGVLELIDDLDGEVTLRFNDGSSETVQLTNVQDFAGQGENGVFFVSFKDFTQSTDVIGIDVSLDSSGTVITIFGEAPGWDLGDAPDSYATDLTDNGGEGVGPSHRIEPNGRALHMGTEPPDSERDATPTASADGDDTVPGTPVAPNEAIDYVSDYDDEDGVVFPSFDSLAVGEVVSCDGYDVPNNTPADVYYYCAAVEVTNETDNDAQLVGWIDFNGDGDFDNDASCGTNGEIDNNTCERSAAEVFIGDTGFEDLPGNTSGTCSQIGLGTGDSFGGTDFTSHNIPANCQGTVVLRWQYDTTAAVELTSDSTYARFRITSDQNNGFFDTSGPAPIGSQSQADGEVEDFLLEAGTVPVSISAFDSRMTRSGLEVSWTTVSETENIGFHIWADTGKSFELLTEKMVPSRADDAVGVNEYSVLLRNREALAAKSLSITAVDTRGDEEMYGLFDVGRAYGRKAATASIPWQSLRSQMDQRLAMLGYEQGDQGLRRNDAGARPAAVDFAVASEGMQSIGFDELAAAGLDLRGVDPDAIAVTLKGEPVARRIADAPARDSYVRRGNRSPASVGTSGSEIHFWGETPGYPDALYVSEYVYRVSVDASKALAAGEVERARWRVANPMHTESIVLNEDNGYSFASILTDPWYAKKLSTSGSNKDSYSTTFNLPSRASTREPARIEVVVGGVTDYSVAPDHHVEVLVNGQPVGEAKFDGRIEYRLAADLEPGVLQRGDNQVTVRLPHGTEAPHDLVYVDTIEATFASRLSAENDRLLIERGQAAEAFRVYSVSKDATAYAYSGDGLVALPVDAMGRGSVVVPAALGSEASYWVSGRDALHRPALIGAVAPNSARRQAADFVVIAHPAFLPASPFEAHPLNDFVDARRSEGWSVQVVDVTEIQLHHGGGMALPEAVTNYLREAHAKGTSHVLLVGGDSYDYHDRLGLGSISHIPTVYQPTKYIGHTPSDGLLADVDDDGVSDLALGRWPVRSMSDLQSIVSKTLDWDVTTSGLQNSVWVTDTDDPNVASFEAQGERMAQTLVDGGWIDGNVDRIHMNDIGQGFGAATSARDELFQALADGRSLTGFVGHGSPSAWTFQSLLFPSDVGQLNNDGYPTLIGTLTCYTSYFVSPHNDTVAHRFMNGYRIGENGEPVFGAPNGAVAVHGAATLSNYLQNEYFAKGVLERQLDGATLGSAVLSTRQEAAERGIDDLVINWTLLGDPTLRMANE
jgi:hypothetical protein